MMARRVAKTTANANLATEPSEDASLVPVVAPVVDVAAVVVADVVVADVVVADVVVPEVVVPPVVVEGAVNDRTITFWPQTQVLGDALVIRASAPTDTVPVPMELKGVHGTSTVMDPVRIPECVIQLATAF